MGVFKQSILAQGLLLWSLASADASNLNPNGDGCVDPSGYLKCYSDNVDNLTTCMTDAQNNCVGADALQLCEEACGNVQLAANIGCWLTSCWNEVYSCSYQETVLQYLNGADLEQSSNPVPYYPAPDNAPGGCVCNLGYVWGNLTETYALNNPCSAYDIVSSGVETEADCQCCWDSSNLSNVIELCPNNDLSDLAFDEFLESFESGNNNTASDNCSILSDGNQCVSSFSLDTLATTWYNPGALPSGVPGTAPLSDTTGAGSLTSAPDPYTYSVFPSYISVITPAPYNAKNVAGSGTNSAATNTGTGSTSGASATGTSTGTSTGSGTGTGTGTGSASSTTKTGAAAIVSPAILGFGAWGLAIPVVGCALLSGAAFVA